jgi:hypothetical protein
MQKIVVSVALLLFPSHFVFAQATAAIIGRVVDQAGAVLPGATVTVTIINRANFGNNFGGNAFSPATYNQPTGYLGGIASTSTIPISFQVQFGTRFSF